MIVTPRYGNAYRINTLGPRQNSRHFPDNIYKCIFLNENVWISIKISLKFDPKGPNNNIPALVQIMAWRRPGDKPLSEPMMVSFRTHICVTRPQWLNDLWEGTPPVTATKAGKGELWCFLWCHPGQVAEKNARVAGDLRRHDVYMTSS